MAGIDTLLNNTILIPSMDPLVASNPLPDSPIGKKVQEFNTNFDEQETVNSSQFQVYFVSGGKSVLAGMCENIEGLSVSRQVETKKSGGNGDYTVKVPGAVSYSVVKFDHFYSDSDVFMNWLINGADWGGIQKADIEIHVGHEGNKMVYTLRDAFPIKWNLGKMSVNAEGLVTRKETLTYTISEDQILAENVSIAYGRLDYTHGK